MGKILRKWKNYRIGMCEVDYSWAIDWLKNIKAQTEFVNTIKSLIYYSIVSIFKIKNYIFYKKLIITF